MANDATSKSTSNSDSLESSSLSTAGDQQKVPPLRIVLNSAGNQKSSSITTTGSQQTTTKRAHDARQESTLKSGRVRIKLGTNRQSSGKGTVQSDTTDSSTKGENQRTKEKTNDKQLENVNEDSTSSISHLRRITRRSQRTVQSINNEDEESISSMTSIDENLNSTNSIQPNSDTTQDFNQSNPTATASTGSTNNATNGSANADTPRRYKRKKLESSESQSLECDSLLGPLNYKLPHQNSFELSRNIRKHVDKRLKSLSCVHSRTPYGFRDYMLSRGAYLLDGNRLGNGTDLFMNEHGGLDSAPIGKFHIIRHTRVSYSVPNRAKVPIGIPLNSPLYDLFIEQEKERHRMRIQHIKEREKLTLAAEQEFMRVYNQAALTAANQTETFSVCTMLKHQEMYNYIDSDGTTILSREDAQQDQVEKPDGVRTRRRQHGQISPGPARRTISSEDSGVTSETTKPKESEEQNQAAETKESDTSKPITDSTGKENLAEDDDSGQSRDPSTATVATTDKTSTEVNRKDSTDPQTETNDPPSDAKASSDVDPLKKERSEKIEEKTESSPTDTKTDGHLESSNSSITQAQLGTDATVEKSTGKSKAITSDDIDDNTASSDNKSLDSVVKVTDEETSAINKEKFIGHLQEIDDKWDMIRQEMLTRHKNEAESLHAIQKLEWEWKTKEIGICDVRTTLLIDNALVPKLDIFTQDY